MFVGALFITFVLSDKINLPETKPLHGGIFGWTDALKGQRNMWGNSTIIPQIQIFSGDPNITSILNHFVDKYLTINVTELINDAIDGIFSNSDESAAKRLLSPKDILFPSSARSVFGMKKRVKSDESSQELKNIQLIPFNSANLGITDEEMNIFLGQIFSYATVITILVVFFVISLIFYIVFMFGCCFCCKAQERTCPGIVSIVFFGIAMFLMLFSTFCFFVGTSDLNNVVTLFFSDRLHNYADTAITELANTMDSLVEELPKKLGAPLNNLLNDISSFANNSGASILNIFNDAMGAIDGLDAAFNLYNSDDGIKGKITQFNNNIKAYNDIKTCAASDQIKIEINTEDKTFDSFKGQLGDVKNSIKGIEDFSKLPEDFTDTLVTTLRDFQEKLNSGSLINFGDKPLGDAVRGTKDDILSITDSIRDNEMFDLGVFFGKSFPINIKMTLQSLIIIVPILMLVLTLAFAAAFWTKCCCSRCIATCACCQPCCCNLCLLVLGALGTAGGLIFVLLFGILIDVGDESINYAISKMFTNNAVQIPDINLSDLTQGMVDTISFTPINLKKASIFKNLLESKLDTTFTEFIDLESLLPFDQLGNVIEDALKSASTSIKVEVLTEKVSGMTESFNNKENIPQNFSALFGNNDDVFAGFKEIIDKLGATTEPVTNDCQSKNDNIINSYKDFETGLTEMGTAVDNSLMKINEIVENVDTSVKELADGVKDLVSKLGVNFGMLVATIPSAINTFNVTPLIGTINILKTEILYSIVHCLICVSISAHLFLVGMFIIVLLMWIRRRGMAKQYNGSKSNAFYSSSSSSYSYSSKASKSSKSSKSLKAAKAPKKSKKSKKSSESSAVVSSSSGSSKKLKKKKKNTRHVFGSDNKKDSDESSKSSYSRSNSRSDSSSSSGVGGDAETHIF